MRPAVVFLGGNGHAAVRLTAVRDVLARSDLGFELLDVPYPGFEGRPGAPGLPAFLGSVAATVASVSRPAVLYGTGIGGLLALCLRARGEAGDLPLLLQAPVLWGLERRRLPRGMRLPALRRLLPVVFRLRPFQRRFARRHFLRAQPADRIAAFFDGYARCAALPDLFAWLGPSLLRRLESDLRGRRERLSQIAVWWGGRDRVVALRELEPTERALGVTWPVRLFPDWGHYPMLDEPEAWVAAVADAARTLTASSPPPPPEGPPPASPACRG